EVRVELVEHDVVHQEDHERGGVSMNRVENGSGEIIVKVENVETTQQAAGAGTGAVVIDDRAVAEGRRDVNGLSGRYGYVVVRVVMATRAADCAQELGPAMRVIVGQFAPHFNAIDQSGMSRACAAIEQHGRKDRRVQEVC